MTIHGRLKGLLSHTSATWRPTVRPEEIIPRNSPIILFLYAQESHLLFFCAADYSQVYYLSFSTNLASKVVKNKNDVTLLAFLQNKRGQIPPMAFERCGNMFQAPNSHY